MEANIERSDHRGGGDLEHGLEALRQSSEFRGPVEPPDDHEHPKDHLALIYESRKEQFATVIPFIRQGLEQGERCLYIADENSREDVLEAMRTRGINVDAALNSGALTIHTKQDTYLKNGEFDPDEMIAYLTDTISEALEEYDGFRATGEVTWILGDEPRIEDFMEYESKLTSVYSRENVIGLCQYNRERFPPEVIRHVINTHPHLIHDNVVSQNVYYTPPEEFLGPDQPAREIDRMLGTLQDRTEAKAELAGRQRFLHESYKITSNPEHSFEEKLEQLLDLGREWFGLEMAALSELPSWDGKFRLEKGIGLGIEPEEKPFWTDPGEECFCRQTITEDTPVSQVDVRETQWKDDSIYQELGLTSYLGTKVMCGSTPYGTLWFGSTEPRERPFSDIERTFIELMGQWVSYEIERREHKQSQRELCELTADTERTFDEKLQAVFDLGCDRFDLDLGGIARVDPETDLFEVETMSGEHDHLVPGEQYPLSETYCRLVTDEGETAGVTDPVSRGFDGKLCYERFGVRSYLGTHFGLEGGDGRTFFFLSNQPREPEFSEAEHTFHHLMGQWVKYELERQQRERELRERTEHLSALVETTPECIKTVAPDGTLLQMNPAGLDMVEADSEEDVVDECVYDLIAPEHRETFREFNERICRGERGALEFDIIGLEGTRRHMESHAAPLERPDGTTVQVAVTRDVTERKEREAELRQTKNRFETVFEDSDDGIFILDPHTDDLVDANPAAAEMTGYSRDDLLSLAPSDLHPDEMEQFRAFLDEVQETGSAWSEELHCRHKDGYDIPVEITASAITLDGRDLVLALVRDISERKTHERYQRELYEITADPARSFEEKLQDLFDLGCERFDLEMGGLNQVDPHADRFQVEYISDDHDLFEPGVELPLSETYCQAVAGIKETATVSDPLEEGFDDTLVYEEYGAQAYLGTHVPVNGDVDRTLGFIASEPRSKPFSEEERAYLNLMGQWVKYELENQQYAQELEETIDQLQQSNDRLKQFAYAASHDLQEPLRMVSSYLQLLETKYENDLDEEAQEYIDFAVDGADRMREMVDDLLAYSRVEQSDGEFEPVDCGTVIERVRDDLQVQIEENDAEIAIESLPTVVADSEQLEQLFSNLVSNAVKYNDSESPRVDITAEERPDHWEFSIADNGIGIDPEKTDRIFEVFKRLHHDDEYQGTGIGLSLCQEIVDNHDGDIWVESEPGEGSTFYVTLPGTDAE